MKILRIPEVRLTSRTLDDALDAVFGIDTLTKVHGPTLDTTTMTTSSTIDSFSDDGRRKFSFVVETSGIPGAIKKFVCGDDVKVTTTQTLSKKVPTKWSVTNVLKTKFLGSELFQVRPVFWLQQDRHGTVTLGGTIRHDAILPPPLNDIAETFMMQLSERELRRFETVLESDGYLPSSTNDPWHAAAEAIRKRIT